MDSPIFLAIHKPKGPTSHDIVDQVRRYFRGQKVGHAGTLDPLASGVLVLGIGRQATKLLHTEQLNEKEYEVAVRLGQSSTTDDAEGEKTEWKVESIPSFEQVQSAVTGFIGQIDQVPPLYSAVKTAGVRAYRQARRGEQIELKPRPVEIKQIEILDYHWPILRLRVATGRGVYIRSLARDIGHQLGVGGYVEELIRTRVGEYRLDKAVDLSQLEIEAQRLLPRLNKSD